ncbi:hypothetical protein TYRP_021246 [Tyrophagus putrescentiae]|nr:hypothetical protein TYRP_021246 [Tyrophagus putrescentiae]
MTTTTTTTTTTTSTVLSFLQRHLLLYTPSATQVAQYGARAACLVEKQQNRREKVKKEETLNSKTNLKASFLPLYYAYLLLLAVRLLLLTFDHPVEGVDGGFTARYDLLISTLAA